MYTPRNSDDENKTRIVERRLYELIKCVVYPTQDIRKS